MPRRNRPLPASVQASWIRKKLPSPNGWRKLPRSRPPSLRSLGYAGAYTILRECVHATRPPRKPPLSAEIDGIEQSVACRQLAQQTVDPTIADSILDRLIHSANRFELDGESIRRKQRGRS
jgi:IstB-like ATP binding protein